MFITRPLNRVPIVTAALALIFTQVSLVGQMRHTTAPPDPYHRIYVLVPLQGAGTAADPKRPMFVPVVGFPGLLPGKPTPASPVIARSGIIGYHSQITDDGKDAIVEFIAANPSAFQEILSSKDARVQVFQKGIHKVSDMEAAFKVRKKDFSFSTFQTRVH